MGKGELKYFIACAFELPRPQEDRACLAKVLPAAYTFNNRHYNYINTNEIPGELSRENMISSHVKRSSLLWLHNKWRLSKRIVKGLVFLGVYVINRTLHGRLEIQNFSSRVENISLVRCTHS